MGRAYVALPNIIIAERYSCAPLYMPGWPSDCSEFTLRYAQCHLPITLL